MASPRSPGVNAARIMRMFDDEDGSVDLSSDLDCPQEYICPITGHIMEQPVTAADGTNYDERALTSWLKTHTISPMSGKKLVSKHAMDNSALRASIEQYVAKLPAKPTRFSSEEIDRLVEQRAVDLDIAIAEKLTLDPAPSGRQQPPPTQAQTQTPAAAPSRSATDRKVPAGSRFQVLAADEIAIYAGDDRTWSWPQPGVSSRLGGGTAGVSGGGGGASTAPSVSVCVRAYQSEAKMKNPCALNNLAWCTFFGVGDVPRNESHSIELFKQAATAGSLTAQCNLSWAYATGRGGVQSDVQRAFLMLAELCEPSNKSTTKPAIASESGTGGALSCPPMARVRHASALLLGLGTDQDAQLALQILHPLATSSSPSLSASASSSPAVRPSQSVPPTPQTPQAAFPPAQWLLALAMRTGQGCRSDEGKAMELVREAAAARYAPALFTLGCCYEHGWGVQADIRRAREQWARAAELGHSTSKAYLRRATFPQADG